jgi:hypothetical protein
VPTTLSTSRRPPGANRLHQLFGSGLVARDSHSETIEVEPDDGQLLNRPVVQLGGDPHPLLLGDLDGTSEQTRSFALARFQLRVLPAKLLLREAALGDVRRHRESGLGLAVVSNRVSASNSWRRALAACANRRRRLATRTPTAIATRTASTCSTGPSKG